MTGRTVWSWLGMGIFVVGVLVMASYSGRLAVGVVLTLLGSGLMHFAAEHYRSRL